MKRLAIIGASGHGKVVADIAECCDWQKIDFFDDAWPNVSTNGTWQVVGDTETFLAEKSGYDGVIVGIGNSIVRHQKIQLLKAAGANLVSLVHPSACVSRYASVGVGSVVMAGVVVNVDVKIGCGTILNTGCSIDHDCELGDSVHVSPGARLAGDVCVGDRSWVGIGAVVRQSVVIGKNVMVGAGAAVISNLPDGVTALGVPAKITSNT